jgi:toxin ParE1/3/4
MLPLVWTDDATSDLLAILDYIGAHDVAAADRLNDLLQRAAGRLPLHPYMHRRGRVAGTREAIVHPNYLIIYRVSREAIEILAVVHARRRYP